MADIVSPLPGVFYRKPAPDKDPFVAEGDSVEPGQTVGIVEIMKQFTEIKAEAAGTVKEIPTEDGAMVEPGQVLIVLEEV